MASRGFSRTDYKKAELVEVVYEDFAAYFVPGLSISYDPLRETHFQAIDRLVPKVTDELIQERASLIRADLEKQKQAVNNPETIRDFETFIICRGKDKLTNEQLIKFESLKAAETRRYRSWHDDRKYNIEETQIPETLELTISKSYHSKKDCDIWVVEMSERVERFVFDDLKSRAKSLGGYYSKFSKGFVFECENDANQFVSLSAIDGEANKERAEENRRNKAIEHLETVSDNLEAEATATLETDRKTNTARRARMANSIEESANNDLQFEQTIKNIANALESDEIFMLNRVRYGADIEELESQLYQARNRATRELKSENWNRTPTLEDINFAKYPYPEINKALLERAIEITKDLDGFKLLSARISKYCNNSQDAWVKLYNQGIDDLQDFSSKIKYISKISKWDKERINNSLLSWKRLQRMNKNNEIELKVALREYISLKAQEIEPDPIKLAKRNLIGRKIQGFVPTPTATVETMLEYAEISSGMRVLEPSAGSGNIAELIAEIEGIELDVIEQYSDLRELLKLQGFNLIGSNSLQYEPESPCYDRILMNPAWERQHDIDEILHCYEKALAPGGRLVAICSAGSISRIDKKAQNFQEWLEIVGATIEQLPDDAFVPSGCRARGYIIVADKPELGTVAIEKDSEENQSQLTLELKNSESNCESSDEIISKENNISNEENKAFEEVTTSEVCDIEKSSEIELENDDNGSTSEIVSKENANEAEERILAETVNNSKIVAFPLQHMPKDNSKELELYKEFVIKAIAQNKWSEIQSFEIFSLSNSQPYS